MRFAPARWLPGAHAMTIYGSVARPLPRPRGTRERLELADGDFVDVDRHEGATPDAPVLVVCHGLEGSSRAPYVRGIVALARARGLAVAALNFRGCSGEPNRLPRFYHSGDTADLAALVAHLDRERTGRAVVVAGFSLGGNVVAKWFGESGDRLPPQVKGGAVISVPFDLGRCADAIDGPGLMPWIYRERFLRRLRAKVLAKAARFPEAFNLASVRAARSFFAFDDAVTAPVHGFPSARAYYEASSAGRFVSGIRRPLLALSASDDPMVPRATLPVEAARDNPHLALEVSEFGGHVAFVGGTPWRPLYWAEARAVSFLEGTLSA
jgi:predicted alpha/beta-fold hydrolase